MGKFSALEKNELTQNWTLEERTALAHFLETREVEKNKEIISRQTKEEAKERGVYFLEAGKVLMKVETSSVTVSAGVSFGEYSLVSDHKKQVMALATSPVTLHFLSLERWEELKRVTPLVGMKLLEAIVAKTAKLLSDAPSPPKVSAGLR